MSVAEQLGVIVVDADGKVAHADETAGRLCGWAPELLTGRELERVLRPVSAEHPDAERAQEIFLTSAAQRVAVTRRSLGEGRDEAVLLLAPVSRADRLDPLDDLRARLEEVARLSHKINNPLASVLGRVQLLRMTGADPKIDRAAKIIEESAQRIAGYVRELAVTAQQTGEPIHAGLARGDQRK